MIVIGACTPQEQETKKIERIGFDLGGLERTCDTAPKDEMCTMVFTEAEQFAQDCRDAGFEAIQCGCHEYLCTGQITRTGRDINGEERSCVPAPNDLICTQEFTPGDQFAQDCEASGMEAVACGCHDYICVEKEPENVLN